ncbi:unnamed protein product [Choristocarpus tenellus]
MIARKHESAASTPVSPPGEGQEAKPFHGSRVEEGKEVGAYMHEDLGPTKTFRCVSWAEEMNPGWRTTMEDAHRIIPHFDEDPLTSFFGVYDGHGVGRATVDLVESRLDEVLAEELKTPGDDSMEQRIIRSFLRTDVDTKLANIVTSGATAVTCLIKVEKDEKTIHAANVGDSRAVLCRDGEAIRLTYDHKAEDEGEKKRLEAAGGFVLRNRVLGILAVARSFGDQGMKEFVTAVPHVSETRVCSKCSFLVLACDGIWDVFLDAEAVRFIEEAISSNMAEKDVAGALLKEAIARGRQVLFFSLLLLLLDEVVLFAVGS